MSSVQRCFAIGELLLIIVEMVHEDEFWGQGNLLRFAKTCKAVSNLALPVLWSSVDIAWLLELLVDDGPNVVRNYAGTIWTPRERVPTADFRPRILAPGANLDFSRIGRHREWVRRLHWGKHSLHESALENLEGTCAHYGALCPNLKELKLSQIPDEWIHRFSSIFGYSRIPELLMDFQAPTLSWDLRNHPVLLLFPNLKRFRGHWSSFEGNIHALLHLPYLRCIQTNVHLSGDALSTILLSQKISQACFHVYTADLNSAVRQATQSDDPIFPALQKLQLYIDHVSALPTFLNAFRSSSLTVLHIDFDEHPTLDKFFGALGCSTLRYSLKTLTLTCSWNMSQKEDPQEPTITCKMLRHVAKLTALRYLWLGLPELILDEQELPETLFTFPPNLGDIYIYTCQPCGLSLDALRHFAFCCPQVRSLGLTLEAPQGPSHLPEQWVSTSRLEYLKLESAPEDHPAEIGAFLSALFPRLCLVRMAERRGELTEDEWLTFCETMKEAAGRDIVFDGSPWSSGVPSGREARLHGEFEWF
ncbi:hypothetical protein CERSUDRAFT_100003 [Gelatoporia subvermispora B]|uniref:F-box domain-containing protein n=1 Tax=Ceriporiopsis subvermispora (strain B) TaxID=914234 RepID=M2Q4N8_CERS8|nr:hypothetical protein CERSUDRAFT_100003 [Gelatoporia subvermispora B]